MTLIVPHRRGLLSSGFDPRSLAGLQLWLAADRIVANDGDPVQTWGDLSGQGNDATQATLAKRPLDKTGQVNGRTVVRTDGVDDEIDTAALPALTASTLIVVYRPRIIQATNLRIIGMFGATIMKLQAASTGAIQFQVAAGAAITPGTLSAGAAALLSGVYNGATLQAWLNGLSSGTVAATGTVTSAALQVSGGNGTFADGDFCEVALWNRALSSAERAQVETYLRTKWGTP